MTGLLREHQLTLSTVVRRILRHHPHHLVVDAEGRTTWGDVVDRALRLVEALRALGIQPGDRVASYAGNHRRHLELSVAVPCLGAVLHPLDVRATPENVARTVRNSRDQLVFVDAALCDRFDKVRTHLDRETQYVVLDDHTAGADPDDADPDGLPSGFESAPRYEELLADQPSHAELPSLDERTAALLCHTGGTTGTPKGVLSSHRAQLLLTFGLCAADGLGISKTDSVLLLAPMWRGVAWGIPYAAAMTGAHLVMASPDADPRAIVDTITAEQITLAAGESAVWSGVADHLDATPGSEALRSLRALVIGGAAANRRLAARYADHGVPVLYGWGMTETMCHASLTRVGPNRHGPTDRGGEGTPLPGIEVRVCDEDGRELPWDGTSAGELEVRGAWVATDYAGANPTQRAAACHDGWLRTGDLVTIDRYGEIRMVDRITDLVTAHGDWISSTELEHLLVTHPAVAEAAVVAVPHPEWGERPMALVVRTGTVSAGELRAHLANQVPHWWLPDNYVFCPSIPRSASGGYDKRLIRAYLRASRAGSNHSGASRWYSSTSRTGSPRRRVGTTPPPAQRTSSDPVEAAPDTR